MEWGAGQIALVIAGALFLCGIVAAVQPRLVVAVAAGVHVFSARDGRPVAQVTRPTPSQAPSQRVSDASSQARCAIDPAASSAELEELAYAHPEARCAVASHAATPSSVLSWLASHGDDAVIEAIAKRPQSEHSEHPPR